MIDIARRLEQLERRLKDLERMEAGVSGTWTVTYLGGTSAGATTYTTQVTKYTQIGDVVAFSLFVIWTAASGTGNARVSLPFTTANVANQYGSAVVWIQDVTYTGTGVQAIIAPNTAYIEFSTPISNNVPTVLAVEAAGRFVITGLFYV